MLIQTKIDGLTQLKGEITKADGANAAITLVESN